jgi:hypothetical protein
MNKNRQPTMTLEEFRALLPSQQDEKTTVVETHTATHLAAARVDELQILPYEVAPCEEQP